MKTHVLKGPKGQLEIRDVNGDGRYDPGEDKILKGKEIKDPGQVRDDLKAMGIDFKQLPRLRLQPLADYLENMKEAEEFGSKGDFKFMEESLSLAAHAAERAGLEFNKLERSRGPDILTGYSAGCEHYMKLAESYAKKGDDELVETYLKTAMDYATKGEMTYDHSRAREIRESVKSVNPHEEGVNKS